MLCSLKTGKEKAFHQKKIEQSIQRNNHQYSKYSYKGSKTSSALRFTIMAGVFYHIVLGASGFEQLWLVQEGYERSEIAQLVGWIEFLQV